MVRRPDDINAFEFAVLSGLRASQLRRGSRPRVAPSERVAVTAQREVAERKVLRAIPNIEPSTPSVDLTAPDAARSSG